MFAIDHCSRLLARISAWAMFGIGLMLGYEVMARYFFIAPTIWAEELSRLTLVWAVFVGAATLIGNDGHIRVTLATDRLGPSGRRFARILSALFLSLFTATICWTSLPTMLDSLERGRTTGSMMNIPSWWMQAAIPAGFGLMFLQCLVEAIKLIFWPDDLGKVDSTDHRNI